MNLIEYDKHLVHELENIRTCNAKYDDPIEQAIEHILDTIPNDNLIELLLQLIERGNKDQVRSETWQRAKWFVAYNIALNHVENNSIEGWTYMLLQGIQPLGREDVADYVRENFRNIGIQVEDFFGGKS